MSPQNIAIVMSPNLLWSPETSDDDYVSKVNSTASVNMIVEAIVSDYPYFFGEDFTVNDFYVTLSRDDLFPHNGGFPIDRELTRSKMTQSVNIVSGVDFSSASSGSTSNGANSSGELLDGNSGYHSHSRSSSHDTSLILLNSSIDSSIKRSQSNSSLSDASPPHSGSPKLPVRRKHNKQVAPTPPDDRFHRASEHYSSMTSSQPLHFDNMAMKERFLNSINHSPADESCRLIRQEMKASSSTEGGTFKQPQPVSMRRVHGSQENLLSKPDKPPRPALPTVECNTLVRNAFKAKGLDRHGRPVALPRSIANVARSTENLSSAGSPSPVKTSPGVITAHRADSDDADVVMLRDSQHSPIRGDKPAIPERPTSLIKTNFRSTFEKFDAHNASHNHSPQSEHGSNSSIKKTQSFRNSRDSQIGMAMGSITGRSLTTLERTHIYNVDKQQVAIIDVNDQQPGAAKAPAAPANEPPAKSNELSAAGAEANGEQPPQQPPSPRNFEPKLIKRPQIPAPPPPKNVQVASSNSGNEVEEPKAAPVPTVADSTNF